MTIEELKERAFATRECQTVLKDESGKMVLSGTLGEVIITLIEEIENLQRKVERLRTQKDESRTGAG